MAVWILDAGHGGADSGNVGSIIGRKESDIVLEAVLEAKKHLERNGEKVVLTRSDDIYMSLDERMEIARKNNGDYFISFHMNSDIDKSIRGVQAFYYNDNYNNKRLAKLICEELSYNINSNNKGAYHLDDRKKNKCLIDGVIIYGEYLSNEEAEAETDSKCYGRMVAKACLAIVDKVLLLTPVSEPKKMQKRAWMVCVGYYKDYNEAIDAMIDMHNRGYKGTYVAPYDGR